MFLPSEVSLWSIHALITGSRGLSFTNDTCLWKPSTCVQWWVQVLSRGPCSRPHTSDVWRLGTSYYKIYVFSLLLVYWCSSPQHKHLSVTRLQLLHPVRSFFFSKSAKPCLLWCVNNVFKEEKEKRKSLPVEGGALVLFTGSKFLVTVFKL